MVFGLRGGLCREVAVINGWMVVEHTHEKVSKVQFKILILIIDQKVASLL